jgi:hypothetical protein
MHLELISFTATQPNTGAAGVIMAGDSSTIKNANPSKKTIIACAWQTNQVAGFGQITFPSAHDTTRGFRAGTPIGVNPSLLPFGQTMEVRPQELLSVTIAGSNVAADVEQLSLLMHYGDLPGVSQRLLTANEVESKMKRLTTIETSIVSTAGPSYGTALVITTGSDLLKANRDYAILGMSSRTACHTLYLNGPDTGNVRIGMPGVLRQEISSQWFVLMSRIHSLPFVPVINSGNKSSTFVGVTTDENAGTFLQTLYLAEL